MLAAEAAACLAKRGGRAVGVAVAAKLVEGLFTCLIAYVVAAAGTDGPLALTGAAHRLLGAAGGNIFAVVLFCTFANAMAPAMAVNARSLACCTGFAYQPALAAAALLGVCCGVLTHRQTAVWRSSRTLFEHAARVTSGNFVAYGVLATVLVDEGKLDEALEYCQKALALSPGYPEAHNTLGAIYTRQRKFAEAQRHYELALQTDATYSESFAGLADVFNLQRRHVEAEAKAREGDRKSVV